MRVPGERATIQGGIDAATDGDTVLVAAGAYEVAAPITFGGKAITVKSAAGAAATTIRLADAPANPARASLVVFESNERAGAILQGFTLAAGRGSDVAGLRPGSHGGGILFLNSGATVTDCVISGGRAQYGGGIACAMSTPTITRCAISGNTASAGGGVYCLDADATVSASSIAGNVAGLHGPWQVKGGGGIYCEGACSPRFADCTIEGNTWGGLLAERGSSPRVTGCMLAANHDWGIACAAASPELTDCVIVRSIHSGVYCMPDAAPIFVRCVIADTVYEKHDSMVGPTGGVYCDSAARPRLEHCTITGNRRDGYQGAAVCCAPGSAPVLAHCTIAGNAAHAGCGGVYCAQDAAPEIANCILWDNVADSFVNNGGAPVVRYSCIQGAEVFPGEGNINVDPRFCAWGDRAELSIDPAAGPGGDGSPQAPIDSPLAAAARYSLALHESSPCIGAGEAGSSMGADLGTCPNPGEQTCTLFLAPGTYRGSDFRLLGRASVIGADRETTTIEGTLRGARTGARLANLTVTGCISIDPGESPSVENCTVGSIYCGIGSSPSFASCAIRENYGKGVLCAARSAPRFSGCTIAKHNGVGLQADAGASPALADCTISANHGCGVLCVDGAIPTLDRCVIAGNAGPGVQCWPDAAPRLTNCLIFGNTHLWGGGVYGEVRSAPTLVNCTLCNNDWAQVYCEADAGATIVNCIVAGYVDARSLQNRVNVASSCVSGGQLFDGVNGNMAKPPRFVAEGAVDFQRYAAITSGALQWSVPDFIVTPPDCRLLPDSPCIDAGASSGAPGTDLDGQSRPCGPGFDMGAFEACAYPVFVRGDCNADGRVNIADAIHALGYLFRKGAAVCLDAVDMNDDGALNIADPVALLGVLFRGSPPLPAPSTACGRDATPDDVGCESFAPCP